MKIISSGISYSFVLFLVLESLLALTCMPTSVVSNNRGSNTEPRTQLSISTIDGEQLETKPSQEREAAAELAASLESHVDARGSSRDSHWLTSEPVNAYLEDFLYLGPLLAEFNTSAYGRRDSSNTNRFIVSIAGVCCV
jgi:hypothetical protein